MPKRYNVLSYFYKANKLLSYLKIYVSSNFFTEMKTCFKNFNNVIYLIYKYTRFRFIFKICVFMFKPNRISVDQELTTLQFEKMSTRGQFHQHFTSIFICTDPKSAKRYWQLDWIFTILGYARVKASREHVGEIDPPHQLDFR